MAIGDRYWYSTGTTTTANLSNNNVFLTSADISSGTTDELKAKVQQLENLFFREVVVKCSWCGSWGAAMTQCKHCGSPIDLGNDIKK